MLKSVTVTNPKNESLELILSEPEKAGLAVGSITGLGPPKATLASTEFATTDGSIITSTRIPSRNIVFKLYMWPTKKIPLVEDCRLLTYKYFPIKKEVTLLFRTDNRLAECKGVVESNEPDIFSSQESATISIICSDPFFYEKELTEDSFTGVKSLFEFPFSNESLTEDLIELSELRLDNRVILTYRGDVDTGILMKILCLGKVTDIVIYNIETLEKMKINAEKIHLLTGSELKEGDEILISTYPGKKSCELLRDGVYLNIISALDRNPDWFKLSPGDNVFAFAVEPEYERSLMITFSYRNAYGGI